MKVFVESNFVLELVLDQEQSASCQDLLEMAEAKAIQLFIPADSIVEPYETLGRRHRERKRKRTELAQELNQLKRSATAADYAQASTDVLALLSQSADSEAQRIMEVRLRLCKVATIVPLTVEILEIAHASQFMYDFSPQDAVVYASVLSHLSAESASEACFISRNSEDFDSPDILAELSRLHCKYFSRFDAAVRYLKRPGA